MTPPKTRFAGTRRKPSEITFRCGWRHSTLARRPALAGPCSYIWDSLSSPLMQMAVHDRFDRECDPILVCGGPRRSQAGGPTHTRSPNHQLQLSGTQTTDAARRATAGAAHTPACSLRRPPSPLRPSPQQRAELQLHRACAVPDVRAQQSQVSVRQPSSEPGRHRCACPGHRSWWPVRRHGPQEVQAAWPHLRLRQLRGRLRAPRWSSQQRQQHAKAALARRSAGWTA